MRNVALDLGLRKICFCEVSNGKVIARRTVRSLEELEDVLGPETATAQVAIEACREAWAAMTHLEGWGHWPRLVERGLDVRLLPYDRHQLDVEHQRRVPRDRAVLLASIA